MAVAYLYLIEQQEGQIRLELLDVSTRTLLAAVHPDALRYMATPINLYAAFIDRLFEILGSESDDSFCGTELYLCNPKPSLKIDGLARKLTPREAELLFVLWAKPRGMSHEALHAVLYPENESGLSAVRQLLFRLRNKGVGIDERLRLTGPVRVDVDKPSLNYRALLPFSQVPFIIDRRAEREEEFRQRLLRSEDVVWVWKQLESFEEDIELNEHTRQLLPPDDPRRAALTRRLHVLQAD